MESKFSLCRSLYWYGLYNLGKGQGRKWVGLGMFTLFPVISLILLTGANFDISFNLMI